VALTLADIEAEARRRSGEMLTARLSGSDLSLAHPHGPHVELKVMRADLGLSIEEFGAWRLDGPLANLRRMIAEAQ
jgi:hypothetical protein